MMKASIQHRVVVSCPICRADSYRKISRSPADARGHVSTTCVCGRCDARFTYEEDRTGRVVRK